MSFFEPFKIVVDQQEGKWLRDHTATCGCGATAKSRISSTTLPGEVVAKQFRHKGWEIGRHRSGDTCPDCIAAAKVKPPKPAIAAVPAAPKPVQPKIEPTRVEAAVPEVAPSQYVDLEAVRWAKDRRGLSKPTKAVLVIIAGLLDQDGNCDHNSSEIMRLAGFGSERITSSLRQLQDRGLITRQIRNKRGGLSGRLPTRFRLNMNPQPEPNLMSSRSQTGDYNLDRTAQVIALAAAPPHEPDRADKRRVHEAVELAWNYDTGRYRGGATDKSIAAALNVPRKWVSDRREDLFGDEANDDAVEAVTAAKALEQALAALEDRALTLATEAEAMRKSLTAVLAKLPKAA
jgi:hypothetical protein